MLKVIFQDGRFACAKGQKGQGPKFDDGKEYTCLFDYAANDISTISFMLKRYVFKKVNTGPALIDLNGDVNDRENIFEMFKSLHPYFGEGAEDIFIEAIGNCLNILLKGAEFHKRTREHVDEAIKKKFEEDKYKHIKREDKQEIEQVVEKKIEEFKKQKYKEAFYGIAESLGLPMPTGSPLNDFLFDYFGEKEKESWEIAYEKLRYDYGNEPSNETPRIEFDDLFSHAFPDDEIQDESLKEPFHKEIQEQESIQRMIFWFFDINAPVINELTVPQRVRLYANAFKDELGIKPEATQILHPSAFGEGEYFNSALNSLFKYDFHKNPDLMTPEEKAGLESDVREIMGRQKKGVFTEYLVDGLYEFLFLQILSLIKSGAVIKKCRYCERYFIVTNLNAEYCDREPLKNGKTCKVLGSRLAYKEKLDRDEALTQYNYYYNRNHSRVKTGNLKQCEFDEWKTEARKNLSKVKADEISLEYFVELMGGKDAEGAEDSIKRRNKGKTAIKAALKFAKCYAADFVLHASHLFIVVTETGDPFSGTTLQALRETYNKKFISCTYFQHQDINNPAVMLRLISMCKERGIMWGIIYGSKQVYFTVVHDDETQTKTKIIEALNQFKNTGRQTGEILADILND